MVIRSLCKFLVITAASLTLLTNLCSRVLSVDEIGTLCVPAETCEEAEEEGEHDDLFVHDVPQFFEQHYCTSPVSSISTGSNSVVGCDTRNERGPPLC